MRRELRELLIQLDTLSTEVRTLLGENKVTEAEAKMAEVRALRAKIKLEQELDEVEGGEQRSGRQVGGAPATREAEQLESEYRQVFFKALRRRAVSAEERSIAAEYRAMHAGGVDTDPNGDSSLVVPPDIQTRINEVMRTLSDICMYARQETVGTLTGSRVLENGEAITPFPLLTEYQPIGTTNNPRFTPVNYSLGKRGGILPITNDLLRTSDQNIIQYVSRWIAKKHVATKNSLCLAIFNAMTKKALADLKAVNTVLNVDLDPEHSLAATLLTNQDGFNWLDNQFDTLGRPLLTDDLTKPGRKLYKGRPIAVMSNRYLPSDTSDGTKAPLIIGHLAEFLVHFSLGLYELKSTTEGGDAFARDTTDLRTITYDDCRKWDDIAAVYGQLTIS